MSVTDTHRCEFEFYECGRTQTWRKDISCNQIPIYCHFIKHRGEPIWEQNVLVCALELIILTKYLFWCRDCNISGEIGQNHCCWWPGSLRLQAISSNDVIKWIHFPRYWPFVRGIHRSPVNSPHKGQWRRALKFSLICALNKRLSKQSWGWWFETPSHSLWRHCNEINYY